MASRSTLWSSLSIFLLFASFEVYLCVASDTMAPGQSLSGKETLVSAGEVFELGFFTPVNNSQNHYIGIWPKIGPVEKKRVVWVANRDNPVKEPSSSELKLVEDGNLVLFNEFKILEWSTNFSSNTMNSSILVLGDDGNLVLRDRLEPSDVIWQSFDYPTDTLLAGQKMRMNRVTEFRNVFTSWKTLDDPSPGNYSVQIHESRDQYMTWYLSRPYWISGEWNGQNFSSNHEMTSSNFRYFSDEKERYFIFGNHSMSRSTMFVIDPAGQIKQWQWSENDQSWLSPWAQPRGPCHVYDFCGAFSNCAQNDTSTCECLPGFELSRDWASDSYTCVRRIQLQCGNSTYKGESDKFFKIPQTVLSIDQNSSSLGSVQACESACLSSCSCTAYAYDGGRCTTWDGDLLNVQPPQQANFGGVEFFLRVAASEESLDGNRTLSNERNGTIISDSVNRNNRQIWLIVALPIALTLLTLSFIACWLWKRKLKQKGRKDTSQDLLLFDTGVSLETVNDGRRNMTNQEQARKKDADLPIFSFTSVSAATNHFSLANKLGEGGFGPVYKGKLLNGQVVAVKRLSRSSGQGLEELKNETQLIAKLQHRNLVQLLGCCIEGEEKILVYEYMSNNSLDSFIFDANKKGKLDWGNRVHIIKGIAQGLLYLHQYSRVRIIHRDLKSSNILLDSDMNPKISDFGMARIFGGDDSQANTKRIVGTFGYMPPEYAFKGIFSVKSDVFSFGVLVLEILSGKRNTGFDLSDSWNLLEHAWNLWNEERCLELMDPILGEPSFAPTPVRYIHVALLCVQESAADRPTTSDVVAMLNNESVIAPSPKRPAFFVERAVLDESSDTKKLVFSVNHMTHSLIEAR